MKNLLFFVMSILLIMQVTGCGSKNAKQQNSGNTAEKAQGQDQQQSTPIDSTLKEQMNMYKHIKQHEYDEAEKLRQADKAQLKKLQKSQQTSGSQTQSTQNKKSDQNKSSKQSSKSNQKNSSDKSSKSDSNQ
jgi:chemotaxis response regulator CheB